MSPQSYAPRPEQKFISSLEGLRAIAALGVLVTHAAFQTGMDPSTFFGSIFARFDFFVPVFFALSAFVLWRRRHAHTAGVYYRKRLMRIMPAYLVTVVTVLIFIPDGPWLTNLTMTQIYVTDGLMTGLTHLWSLCVEMAFYLVMPLLALVLDRFPARTRVLLIVVGAVVSLGWAYLPFVAASPADGVPNMQIWPPAYACWFAVGMLAAEAEDHVPDKLVRVLRFRPAFWVLALATAWVAGQEWFGPLGLIHPEPAEFLRRVLAGTVFAACVVVPYALAPAPGLLTTAPMRALGRWSYSIFLWHLPVLTIVFPLVGIQVFSGHFLLVTAFTIVITIPVAAISYSLVERIGTKVASTEIPANTSIAVDPAKEEAG